MFIEAVPAVLQFLTERSHASFIRRLPFAFVCHLVASFNRTARVRALRIDLLFDRKSGTGWVSCRDA